MENSKVIGRIREFIERQANAGKKVNVYKKSSELSNYFKQRKIGVGIDIFKEIILKEMADEDFIFERMFSQDTRNT